MKPVLKLLERTKHFVVRNITSVSRNCIMESLFVLQLLKYYKVLKLQILTTRQKPLYIFI